MPASESVKPCHLTWLSIIFYCTPSFAAPIPPSLLHNSVEPAGHICLSSPHRAAQATPR